MLVVRERDHAAADILPLRSSSPRCELSTAPETRGTADLRDFLAAERTFLAWIRTGLALMGFGFVVARFGLFLGEFQLAQGRSAVQPHWFSLWSGTALIAAGICVNLYSAWSHVRLIEELNSGKVTVPRSPRRAVIVAVFLAVVGLAMAIYLTLIRES
jgi:putative membrane protein